MALQFDQLNNQLKTNDSTNANASMVLTPSGTGSVLLNGSGMNSFVQSQTFNTTWANTALTINQTATTAPDGSSTGNSLIPTTTNTIHRINSPSINNIGGITYTVSVYAKANGYNYLYINSFAAIGANTTFNISTGAISTIGNGSATITSVGNGWYRCTVTGTAASTQTNTPFFQVNSTQTGAADESFAGDGTSGIYLWGAQYEIGSTANAYKVTTTTAIYNAPVLSFSGVSNIGLQSDGSLYVQPAGTGALQAQATTSSTVGGNARGANAVDWQTSRDTAAKVASAAYGVVGGGFGNSSTAYQSGVFSGGYNLSGGNNNFIGGGSGNAANGNFLSTFSTIAGGNNNTANGYYNFIGGGTLNSGTSITAVVSALATQQVTIGSLQVALTATNASIKVGQVVVGTGIISTPATYVTSAVVTNTVSAMTSTISTTTLSVTALTGTMYIGTVLTGGSISPATAYVTAQLTATNAAAASPTASASSGSTTLVVSSATGIAVGQFVQPITGINTNTYVLAISGTSITISQATTGVITAGTAINFYTAGNTGTYSLNTSSTGTPTGGTSYTFGISQSASATGTPNLSFYTPHGVVVGGGNNQATGAYSFIGGGGDAGTASNRNVASGDWSVVTGGIGSQATGVASFVGGGGFTGATVIANAASGTASAVVGGVSNTATAQAAFIGGGYQSVASGTFSTISGGRYGSTRSIVGYHVFPACNSPIGASGNSQAALLILAAQTTDATATVLRSDTTAATTTNQVILPNNSAYYFKGEVISGVTGGGNTKGWEFSGVIKRGAGVGTTTLVGSTVTSLYADAGASTWTIAVTADTTNGGLAVTFTGQASTTIRTVAQIRTTEMTF
jgi:hypothetical protein